MRHQAWPLLAVGECGSPPAGQQMAGLLMQVVAWAGSSAIRGQRGPSVSLLIPQRVGGGWSSPSSLHLPPLPAERAACCHCVAGRDAVPIRSVSLSVLWAAWQWGRPPAPTAGWEPEMKFPIWLSLASPVQETQARPLPPGVEQGWGCPLCPLAWESGFFMSIPADSFRLQAPAGPKLGHLVNWKKTQGTQHHIIPQVLRPLTTQPSSFYPAEFFLSFLLYIELLARIFVVFRDESRPSCLVWKSADHRIFT